LYQHTQTGMAIFAAIAMALVVAALVLFMVPVPPGEEAGRWIVAGTCAVLLLAAWFFRSLTITVRDGLLAWSFGPGVIRKSVPVAEIAQLEPTRTSILAGWGIHWTPRGWLYNVSGKEAVRIGLKSGRHFLLGTDEPERLIQAIRAAQGSRETS